MGRVVAVVAVVVLATLRVAAGGAPAAGSESAALTGAAEAFIVAMWDADAGRLKDVSVNGDHEVIDASTGLQAAHNALLDAVAAKFPREGVTRRLAEERKRQLARSMGAAAVRVDGAEGTVTPEGAMPVRLKKVGGVWKVDAGEFFGKGTTPAKVLERQRAVARVDRELAEEVKGGKFSNWKQVGEERGRRIEAAGRN